MKLIPNIENNSELKVAMSKCLNGHLENLDKYNKDENQKQLELCQVGKMLVTYFPGYEIKEVREIPDFILSNGEFEIGLEHEIITNSELRKTHGFFENIFHLAGRDLISEIETQNVLLNCYLHKDLTFTNNQKSELIDLAKRVIIHYIATNELISNSLVSRIVSMKHTQLSICINFGAYMVSDINKELIQKAIDKKESKIEKYKKNTNLPQWLLLVAGGASEYSYDIEQSKIIDIKVKSTFDKVYLMTDFQNELYELK
jgi:hypothetical protein